MVLRPTEIAIELHAHARHSIEVVVRTPDLEAGSHEFAMPVWTPGSYFVREYARHVEAFEVHDQDGVALAWSKSSKNRWRVEVPRRGDVVLRYRVYCRDLSVRTNYVDTHRAFWNGAATYMIARDRFDGPLRIRVRVPERDREPWTTHTSLPVDPDVPDAWFAANFEAACDAPFLCGAMPSTHFDVLGVPHFCVWDGVPEEAHDAIVRDLRACIEAAARVFDGTLPYERYGFFVIADSAGSGGLEHADACVIHMKRSSFRDPNKRVSRIALFAHEHFHSWNGKRMRPAELIEPDLECENYTRELWFVEGVTSYYQELIPMRAALVRREETLDRIAQNIHAVRNVPGRAMQSLAEASFDAWIKLYRPDENTDNQSVSYYKLGAVAAFAIDVLIQAASQGAHDLDDVMRVLWARARDSGAGVTRDGFVEACSRFALRDLSDEIELLVEGREDPPLESWLEPFGLRVEGPTGPPEATLDVRTKRVGGCAKIVSVRRDGAGARLGLSPDDELIAIDGERIRARSFEAILRAQWRPGQDVEILVARRGMIEVLRGALGGRVHGRARMREREAALRWRA